MATDAYRPRVVDDDLDALLTGVKAVSLEGAKAVGKTATAARRAATIHRLDELGGRSLALADPHRLTEGARPVLIDEWQRVPESWDLVRRAVDDRSTPVGAFLLTGSAAPRGIETHSGAGRIVALRMRPMTLVERGVGTPSVSLRQLLTGARDALEGETRVRLETYVDEILASGFPGLRDLPSVSLRAQLDGYLHRIVDRDFGEVGHEVRNPAALRRWMTAYAAASATTASYETIRDAATGGEGQKPAKTTVIPYRDALERLWIVDPLPAWLPTRSRLRRLSFPPKHQLVDPALAARLLGVDASALLEGEPAGPRVPREGTLLGSLFESLVTLDVRVYAQRAEATAQHLRTAAGEHEIDLIVERRDARVLAIEVKLAQDPAEEDLAHLKWLRERIGDELLDAVVITTGRHAYRRRDGIGVVPAALLGP